MLPDSVYYALSGLGWLNCLNNRALPCPNDHRALPYPKDNKALLCPKDNRVLLYPNDNALKGLNK
jgi:hypothetical protein